jgi:hypothetical protein
MSAGSLSANFPQIGSPLVNRDGTIQQAWLQLLINLWNRTGQQSGDITVVDDPNTSAPENPAFLSIQDQILQLESNPNPAASISDIYNQIKSFDNKLSSYWGDISQQIQDVQSLILPQAPLVSTYPQIVFVQPGAVTVANTTTETTLLGSGNKVLPANFFSAKRTLRFNGYGFHSATGVANIRIRVKLNSTTILDTGSLASGVSTDQLVDLKALATCVTPGSSGTLWAQGFYQEQGGGVNAFPMVNNATSAIDTTIAQTIDVTVQWDTASASDSITITNFVIEAI